MQSIRSTDLPKIDRASQKNSRIFVQQNEFESDAHLSIALRPDMTASLMRNTSPVHNTVTMESMCLNPPSFADLTITTDDNREILNRSIESLQRYLNHIENMISMAKHDPDLKPDRTDMASLYLRSSLINCHLERFELAKESATAALQIQVSALAFYRLGCAHYCLKSFDEALKAFMRGIKRDPASLYLKHAIDVTLVRCRSKKDRPEVSYLSPIGRNIKLMTPNKSNSSEKVKAIHQTQPRGGRRSSFLQLQKNMTDW
mmetsp:Transcript_8749/g.8846  ORF Transcript_8749/g.8846 Transcript_8749/m.8846 type:complete len:259 (+) Transcript_8749:125-901(+)